MTVEWKPAEDLTSVVDGVEEVTLLRRGGQAGAPFEAHRSAVLTDAPQPSSGDIVSKNAAWSFPLPADQAAPLPGDRIIDSGGGCWTILEVRRRHPGSPVRCETRSFSIAIPTQGWVTILQAVWDDTGSTPEILSWRPIRTIRAVLQTDEVTANHSLSVPASTESYQLLMVDNFVLNHSNRVVDYTGKVYEVNQYRGAEQLGSLAIADVTPVQQEAN